MRSEAIISKKRLAFRYSRKLRLFPIVFRNSEIIYEKKMYYKFAINSFLIGSIAKIGHLSSVSRYYVLFLRIIFENSRLCSRFLTYPD